MSVRSVPWTDSGVGGGKEGGRLGKKSPVGPFDLGGNIPPENPFPLVSKLVCSSRTLFEFERSDFLSPQFDEDQIVERCNLYWDSGTVTWVLFLYVWRKEDFGYNRRRTTDLRTPTNLCHSCVIPRVVGTTTFSLVYRLFSPFSTSPTSLPHIVYRSRIFHPSFLRDSVSLSVCNPYGNRYLKQETFRLRNLPRSIPRSLELGWVCHGTGSSGEPDLPPPLLGDLKGMNPASYTLSCPLRSIHDRGRDDFG